LTQLRLKKEKTDGLGDGKTLSDFVPFYEEPKYDTTTNREKLLQNRLKLLEEELKTKNPIKRGGREYIWGVFVEHIFRFNAHLNREETIKIPFAPSGSYKHGKIYKILKDDLKFDFWRAPNSSDFIRNGIDPDEYNT
jgi:hypothetical protein